MANKTLKQKIQGVEQDIYPNITTDNITDKSTLLTKSEASETYITKSEIAEGYSPVISKDYIDAGILNPKNGDTLEDIVKYINNTPLQFLSGWIINISSQSLLALIQQTETWEALCTELNKTFHPISTASKRSLSLNDVGYAGFQYSYIQKSAIDSQILILFSDAMLVGNLVSVDETSNTFRIVIPKKLRDTAEAIQVIVRQSSEDEYITVFDID